MTVTDLASGRWHPREAKTDSAKRTEDWKLTIEDWRSKRITFKGYDTMEAAVGHLTDRQE
jgi:hypothetical protein